MGLSYGQHHVGHKRMKESKIMKIISQTELVDKNAIRLHPHINY